MRANLRIAPHVPILFFLSLSPSGPFDLTPSIADANTERGGTGECTLKIDLMNYVEIIVVYRGDKGHSENA